MIDVLLQRKVPTADQAILCDVDCNTHVDLFDVLKTIDLLLQRISSETPEDIEYAVEILHDNLTLIDGAYLKKEALSSGIFDRLKEVWAKAKERIEAAES